MQVGQHVETAICPQVLLSEMHTVTLHRNPLQMHLTVGILLEALMSYGLHDYHNRQDVHLLLQSLQQIGHMMLMTH